MKKRKVLFRELSLEIYTDGSVVIDGLDEFFDKKQRTEIIRTLRLIAAKILLFYIKKRKDK